MNINELIQQFEEWQENGESEKIINTIMELPDSALDDDIIVWLWGAYMDVGEFKRAVTVLETQRERKDGECMWHYMLAATLFNRSKDDECAENDDLRLENLRRAKVELARTMNLNPPEELLEQADKMMAMIEDEMCGNDDDEDDLDYENLELYDEDELDALEEHIKEYYGDIPTVFHEISSPDIHCDIACIPPSKKRNYYTLMTMGMGAHIMDIPEELDAEEYGRAELLICLPPDWKVGENDNKWFWPIRLLKDLSRLPINSSTWLGWGHTIDNRVPYAENTDLCSSLLIHPEDVEDGAEKVTLPSGDTVNFFEVIPLYEGEMHFKLDNDTTELLKCMSDVNHVVDINRPNCCENYCPQKRSYFDSADDHSKKISEKNLPIDPINGCNHLAIFLRWCIEHDLVAPEFHQYRQDIIDGVLDGTQTDLRRFIIDYFDGALEMPQLSYLGAGFAHYYYNFNRSDPPFFPADVDDYAEHYFGTERYNSEEFQDEAYLFVPFDENYYNGLSKYIDRAYEIFYPSFLSYQREIWQKMYRAISNHLDITGLIPSCPEDIPHDLKSCVDEAQGMDYSPLLLVIDDDGAVYDEEGLESVLEDSMNSMLTTILIMKIPGHNLLVWAKEHFNAAEPFGIPENENLDELDRRCTEKLGGIPCVLTFDEDRSTLFMPLGGGRHICFTGDGIHTESAELEEESE